ncbi:MAG: hypothetical protein ACREXT_05025 [Gammaproteobacteria bacterium]
MTELTHDQKSYGKDAAEWVSCWDAGDVIWTIEMGGMGSGYEQAIQVTCVEMVRWFIVNKTDAAEFADEKKYPALRDRMDDALFAENGPLKGMGLTGAQVGAARNLACHIYRDGPTATLTDEHVKDRKIMVSKAWPRTNEAAQMTNPPPSEPSEPRTTLADGTQIYPGHREIDPKTGQQKGYVVLAEEERAKGFVRPYRNEYTHLKCGQITNMGRTLSETYARDPFFYSGTFCAHCRNHFPVGPKGEFVWVGTDEKVGT